MSQPATSAFCKAVGINWKTESLDAIREAYIRNLREQASGRSSDDSAYDLVSERARLAHHQANIAALDEETKRKTLIPAEQVRAKWQDMLASFRARLLSLPTRIAASCVGLDESAIEKAARDLVHQSLDELSRGDGVD